LAIGGLQVLDGPKDANVAIPAFVVDVLDDDGGLSMYQSVGADPLVDLGHLSSPLHQVRTPLLNHAAHIRVSLCLECDGSVL
jgi:hypothetical protein